MRLLRNALLEGSFLLDLDAPDMASIIRQVMDYVVARGVLPAESREEVEAGILRREETSSTAIGNAVAVPHTYSDAFTQPVIVFVRLAHAINLGAPDGVPTRFLFVLLGPTSATAQHLDSLAAIARLVSDEEFRYEADEARTQLDLLAALDHFRNRTAPRDDKPEEPVGDASLQSRGLFGGLVGDIQRRLPHYASDFRDGLHTKCLASIMFLFFACLAPTVTFGGIMGQQTNGEIGVVEMLVACALCGVVYALFSGQPLNILGGTGPMLVFTVMLYRICADLGVPFLPAYAWVGLWGGLFLLLMTITNVSNLMSYFTRFTDEIFAALISMIFIYEAIKALVKTFVDLDSLQHHDAALLSIILAFGTYYVAMSLSQFRRSRYLFNWAREFFADFGPTIAIVSMTIVAVLLQEVEFLERLKAPASFGTTNGRPWLVNLFGGPSWVPFAAILPALLLAVLVFLDQNITARLVNSPDHKLQKGSAYHLDLGVIGVLVGICSMFGLPWFVAATVRSLNHVRSLASVEEVVSPNGDTRERVIHVRENRISPLAIHLMVGAAVVLLPLLKVVPMAVLYGLFLYMGIVSMTGNQFFDRLKLWFTDSSLYPATHYIRRVPTWTMHKFTLLQLVCLAVLWMVKAHEKLGLLFPICIALLVPIRFLANRWFEPEHLDALDSEEEPEEEQTHWSV